MGPRTANMMEKVMNWVRETSRKVAQAVYQPFKSLPSIKNLEAKRDYYKERSNASLYTYLITLGKNRRSIFGKNIKTFVESTLKSEEKDAVAIMKNVRQFMDSMKSYLIANGGSKFDNEVSKAEENGKKRFNLDEVLENVICELVLIPLKEHVDDIIFKEYSTSVTTVMDNMYEIRDLQLNEIGVRSHIMPFSEEELSVLSNSFYLMQTSELPSEKLKHFLAAVSSIYKYSRSFVSGKKIEICADDFIPLLVWVLSKCRTYTVEVEGLYMWYLMNPSLKDGECGYYITSLLCAGSLLNEPNKLFDEGTSGEPCPCCACKKETLKEIKVVVIDEFTGLPVTTRVLPLKSNVKAKEICLAMAKRLTIKHPEFYGLFVLIDGKAKPLCDNDCPEIIQESVRKYGRRKNCIFLYKEINRKLAWPFECNRR